ncbi:transglycosylase SLT domain-containing protein [Denitrificimonas sp. JX-1]|uniref:Transglycosylase SLT domain-containing protein n=1 Tax=Denitrificimonas halotolerans TaxID=3098930 RepID=A0ABU5GQY9_9GAMM|nr:transglycosylase SLT domain-containing protein [Denitrificimonas sp. JX-1]MDY7219042.1 transglycosylase SLT domain-containing protein [Denitrificimonas sp. JX-1]
MRSRYLLPLFLLITALSSISLTVHAANIAQQRSLYLQAKQALSNKDPSVYFTHRATLRDYPLTPYLAYEELTQRLATANNEEIEKFLLEHGDLPQIRWMKLRWLRLLSQRQQWSLFLKYYDPELNFTELDCYFAQYQFHSGQTQAAFASTEKLWLSARSQPNACDSVFSSWRDAGQQTEDKVWQRLKLATDAGNFGVTKYLVTLLNTQQAQGHRLLDVAQNPEQLKNTGNFTRRDKKSAEIIALGLRKLARKDLNASLQLLNYYGKEFTFNTEDRLALAHDIGLRLAKRFDPRALAVMEKYDPKLENSNLTEWRVRLLLRLGRWSEAYNLIRKLPAELAHANRWRYWQARSLQLAQPNNQQPLVMYQPLARERDFYGFLAADHSQQPYYLNHQPVKVSSRILSKLRNTAAIKRALELDALEDVTESRREWYHLSDSLSREELLAQARLAYELGWYFPAIRTMSKARYWDDLEIRFPMAHKNNFLTQAKTRNINTSWMFAVTRQESAFMVQAKSHVGAMGLMQLMPATAKETAQRYGIPLSTPRSAVIPSINIQLGAAYLSQVLNQFKGNRILASAAYNAGPGRVRQWLRDAKHLPYDVWVETIPFDETRSYVQNVLTYSVIYGEKLQQPTPLVDWHERSFLQQ